MKGKKLNVQYKKSQKIEGYVTTNRYTYLYTKKSVNPKND